MEKEKIYTLRPHHGMCLAYFEGKGYSSSFCVHMGEVLEKLEKGARVKLTVAGDEICAACPNMKQGMCSTAERTAFYDRSVLDRCGLRENEILGFQEFVSKVEREILKPGKRKEICGGCQWDEICKKKKSRWEK